MAVEQKPYAPVIWATYGTTDSGDDLDIVLWKKRPTHKEVNSEYRARYPIEYETVGHVNFQITIASWVGE